MEAMKIVLLQNAKTSGRGTVGRVPVSWRIGVGF